RASFIAGAAIGRHDDGEVFPRDQQHPRVQPGGTAEVGPSFRDFARQHFASAGGRWGFEQRIVPTSGSQLVRAETSEIPDRAMAPATCCRQQLLSRPLPIRYRHVSRARLDMRRRLVRSILGARIAEARRRHGQRLENMLYYKVLELSARS